MLSKTTNVWMCYGIGLLTILLTDIANAQDRSAARPNILIITADNLGYGDLPCFDSTSEVLAPHLDELATQGARLTSFYTASPTCTVSRACLLTGRIAPRHGLTFQLPGIEGNYGPGLDSRETLIPQVLKSAGYTSGCFGKWNIGFARGSRPTERGFDEFLGHASGNIDYFTHVYNGKHDMFRGVKEAHVSGYSTDLFADAACEFIERHTWPNNRGLCTCHSMPLTSPILATRRRAHLAFGRRRLRPFRCTATTPIRRTSASVTVLLLQRWILR